MLLILQQAAVYIKTQDKKLRNIGAKFNINDYLNKFKETIEEFLKYEFPPLNDSDYTKIFTIWNITLNKIKQKKNGNNALGIILHLILFLKIYQWIYF